MSSAFSFPGNGSVNKLLSEYDWSSSVLGDPDNWPKALRAVVRLVLSSKFPMFVAWGPTLGFLYNDAYAEILGNKHPAALGKRFQDIWPEIWSDICPVIDNALHGESSYFEDLPLIVERTGFPERAWFTFSYSPLYEDDGKVGGIHGSVVETTRSVLDGMHRRFQLELADRLYPLSRPDEIVSAGTEMLGRHLGAAGCWYAQIDDAEGTFRTRGGWFSLDAIALPATGTIADFSTELLPVLRSGSAFICNDLVSDPRTSEFADRYAELKIRAILIVPVLKDGRVVFNINAIHPMPHVWTSEEVQAAREVLERTWFAVENSIAQQNLTIERDLSDQILDSMSDGFMLVDSHRRIARINPSGLNILNLSEQSIIGQELTGVLGCDHSGLAGPAPVEIEKAIRAGEKCWLEVRTHPVADGSIAVFFRDVTSPKRAALALRDSEAHLAALFGQTSAGIAERDLTGRLIRVNQRMAVLLGRPENELLGLNLHELTHPDDRAASEQAFHQLLVNGQPFDIDKRYVRPDGSVVWVNTTVSPIRGEDGSNASVLSVIVDITKRKEAEAALENETRVLDLLNHSGQAFSATLDLQTLLQTITDSGREVTGAQFAAFFYNGRGSDGEAYRLFTLSGAPRSAFEGFGHPRATPVFKPTFDGEGITRSDDITRDPRYGTMSPHHGMPKGHPPVRSFLAAPVISRSGEVMGGVFFGHQEPGRFSEKTERMISGLVAQAAIAIDNARLYELAQQAANERQELLARERAARAEAERLNHSKDEFLAMLAHELRNPLAPVSAASEILRLNGTDPAVARQVSDIISRQIRHFTRLIDDLMDVSRVTRGLIQLELGPLDLKTLVGASVEQARPMIEYRQHSLTTCTDAHKAVVLGDRTRLIQVVTNLLTNAAKYTPSKGEITLRVEADDVHARISVEDNGSGIETTLLPHLFDLFTQGQRGLDRSQGGLGIGLALVKAIVELHHGSVRASSDGPGKGSKFTVELPLLQDAAPVDPSESKQLHQLPRRLTILLVDDNLDAAHSLAVLLQALGHQVSVAGNAAQALQAVETIAFDAFILDIGLPDMSGYQLVSALRAHPNSADRLYIALTGYGQEQDRRDAKAAGFAHHFVKPVDIRQLIEALAAGVAQRTS
jgi:PAS domain S-box-containing protein